MKLSSINIRMPIESEITLTRIIGTLLIGNRKIYKIKTKLEKHWSVGLKFTRRWLEIKRTKSRDVLKILNASVRTKFHKLTIKNYRRLSAGI